MTRHKQNGFTLIELLIAIAIIGILAAVLIPNLLSARARAFDVGAQTCLKEVATAQEGIKSQFPFAYDTTFDPTTVAACANVAFSVTDVTGNAYEYQATHDSGSNTYMVETGASVTRVP